MPHQCTECGRTFPDGSKEMLSGCPDCGGNKFQFDPNGEGSASGDDRSASRGGSAEDSERPASSATTDGPDRPAGSGSDDPTGRAWPTYGDEPDSIIGASSSGSESRTVDAEEPDRDDGIIEADETPTEDSAQAAARSGFAGPFEVEEGGESTDEADGRVEATDDGADATDADGHPAGADEGPVVDEPDGADEDRPDLAELREELNEQFESIRIKSPGHYELNLMELYDREEYIISLKEDGRYVIEVPETWRSGAEED